MMIQKLRLQRGWSQQQLADLSGLSVRTIQRIEQGQAASTESLKSLAAVFEVDFSTLQEPNMTSEATSTPTSTFHADEALAFAQARKLRGFYLHLIQYVVTLCILLTINLWTSPRYLWVGWLAMGWGIGIFFHGLRTFDRFNPFGAEWEKKQVEKRLGRKL